MKMRISDLGIFNRYLRYDRIQQAKIQKYSNQLSSGKKILSPSDSAIDNARVMRLKSINSEIASYLRNMDFVQTTQNIAEQSFSNVIDAASETKVDIVQLLNTGVLDSEDANIFKQYLQNTRNYIINQANTKVGDNYLFGGIKSQEEPFDINGYYHGETTDTKAPIATGTEVPIKFIGSQSFSTESSKRISIVNGSIDEIDDSGIYQLKQNIEPKSVVIKQIGTTSVNYTDDGQGNIIDNTNTVVGSIDYEKGLVTLINESGNGSASIQLDYDYHEQKIGIVKTIDDINSIIDSGNIAWLHGTISQYGFQDPTSLLKVENSITQLTETSGTSGTYQLSNTPILTKSIFIQSHNGSTVNWKDDGEGNIIDLDNNNAIVGSVDYTNGTITITSDQSDSTSNTITLNNNYIRLDNGQNVVSIAYDQNTTLNDILTKINTATDNSANGKPIFEAFTFKDSDGEYRLGFLNKDEETNQLDVRITGDLAIRTGSFDHILEKFDRHLSNIERSRSKLGTEMKLLENLKEQHEAFQVNYKELISKLEDADFSETITELEKAKTAYEATMASFMQNRDLSLLKYFTR